MSGVPVSGHEPRAADPPGLEGEAIAGAVRKALREVLPLGDAAVDDACPLRSLPGFDSFRLVSVVDRVEELLGVRLPGGAGPEDLADVAGLCRLFARAAGRGRGGR